MNISKEEKSFNSDLPDIQKMLDEDFYRIQEFIFSLNDQLVIVNSDSLELQPKAFIVQLIRQIKVYGTKIIDLYDALDNLYQSQAENSLPLPQSNKHQYQQQNNDYNSNSPNLLDMSSQNLLEISQQHPPQKYPSAQKGKPPSPSQSFEMQHSHSVQQENENLKQIIISLEKQVREQKLLLDNIGQDQYQYFFESLYNLNQASHSDLLQTDDFAQTNEQMSQILLNYFNSEDTFIQGCEALQKLQYLPLPHIQADQMCVWLSLSHKIKDSFLNHLWHTLNIKNAQQDQHQLSSFFKVFSSIEHRLTEILTNKSTKSSNEKSQIQSQEDKIAYLNSQITALQKRLKNEQQELQQRDADLQELLQEFAQTKQAHEAIAVECARMKEEREFSEALEETDMLKRMIAKCNETIQALFEHTLTIDEQILQNVNQALTRLEDDAASSSASLKTAKDVGDVQHADLLWFQSFQDIIKLVGSNTFDLTAETANTNTSPQTIKQYQQQNNAKLEQQRAMNLQTKDNLIRRIDQFKQQQQLANNDNVSQEKKNQHIMNKQTIITKEESLQSQFHQQVPKMVKRLELVIKESQQRIKYTFEQIQTTLKQCDVGEYMHVLLSLLQNELLSQETYIHKTSLFLQQSNSQQYIDNNIEDSNTKQKHSNVKDETELSSALKWDLNNSQSNWETQFAQIQLQQANQIKEYQRRLDKHAHDYHYIVDQLEQYKAESGQIIQQQRETIQSITQQLSTANESRQAIEAQMVDFQKDVKQWKNGFKLIEDDVHKKAAELAKLQEKYDLLEREGTQREEQLLQEQKTVQIWQDKCLNVERAFLEKNEECDLAKRDRKQAQMALQNGNEAYGEQMSQLKSKFEQFKKMYTSKLAKAEEALQLEILQTERYRLESLQYAETTSQLEELCSQHRSAIELRDIQLQQLGSKQCQLEDSLKKSQLEASNVDSIKAKSKQFLQQANAQGMELEKAKCERHDYLAELASMQNSLFQLRTQNEELRLQVQDLQTKLQVQKKEEAINTLNAQNALLQSSQEQQIESDQIQELKNQINLVTLQYQDVVEQNELLESEVSSLQEIIQINQNQLSQSSHQQSKNDTKQYAQIVNNASDSKSRGFVEFDAKEELIKESQLQQQALLEIIQKSEKDQPNNINIQQALENESKSQSKSKPQKQQPPSSGKKFVFRTLQLDEQILEENQQQQQAEFKRLTNIVKNLSNTSSRKYENAKSQHQQGFSSNNPAQQQ